MNCVTLIGNLARDVSLPLQSVVTRQVRLQGSCASSGEYPECLALIASGMGAGKGRLQLAAVLICALCLFFGFTIAVAFSKPLW